MENFFRSMARNKLIVAIVSLVFGLVLIIWQTGAVAGIIRVLGILVLVASVCTFVSYFAGRDKRNPPTLATAILELLVALLLVFAPGWLIALFPVLMGLVLVVSSIFNISALVSAPVKTGMFPLGMVVSVITLVLGLVAIAQPMAMADVLTVIIGIAFLVNGITDLLAVSAMK